MNANEQVRIDVEAAKALNRWKARLASEICERAKRLAAQSSHPDSVTLSHYRQVAESALQSLSAAIREEAANDGRQEAA